MITEAGEIVDAPEFTSKTRFGVIKKYEKQVDRFIQTDNFLQASTELAGSLDNLGTAFTIAKKDMLGNIKRIDDFYSRNPSLYSTLNKIIEEESQGQTNIALAIIWLKRALEFIRAFISGLSAEHKKKVVEENLRPTILKAYEGTLKPYHGVMTQFLFSNITRLAPYRRNLFKTMMVEPEATVDMIISDIDLYLVSFSKTLDLLEELLTNYGLQSEDKV